MQTDTLSSIEFGDDLPDAQIAHLSSERRIYNICDFKPGFVVPQVSLLDARSDEEALQFANSSFVFSVREVWDRDRLVAVLNPH